MSLTKDLQKKMSMAIYDRKDISKKANRVFKSLKECEKTLDSWNKPKK